MLDIVLLPIFCKLQQASTNNFSSPFWSPSSVWSAFASPSCITVKAFSVCLFIFDLNKKNYFLLAKLFWGPKENISTTAFLRLCTVITNKISKKLTSLWWKASKHQFWFCYVQSFYPQRQIAPTILKKNKTEQNPPKQTHTQKKSTAKKNPSQENFLKRMNSIDHTDGTLYERERVKERGRGSERDTDR